MKLIKTEKVNTCNAWGFGGWTGTEKTYDNGLILKEGKNYFRHCKPEKFTVYLIKYDGREIEFSNIRKSDSKYALLFHCVTPEHTHRKRARFTVDEIEPYSEIEYLTKIKLEFEIIKIIKL